MKTYEIAVRVEAWYYCQLQAENEEAAIEEAKKLDLDAMKNEANYIEDYEVVYSNRIQKEEKE